jgi:deoxyribonuclease I
MDAMYPGSGIISKKNRKLFEAWNKLDPVDQWECERARLIEKVQRNENPFIKKGCKQ